ncbi:hypothetical protein [Candidatus Phytoplasma pyri]|uniref:hypothetical protein n=1 Tax=Candidatus Phytoplasma pyri TaxID=47566 RepID=UPI003983A9BD
MDKNKKNNLLKNKKFIGKMNQYFNLVYENSELELREFKSFYELVYESKFDIFDSFCKFLLEIDRKFLNFIKKNKDKENILKTKIQNEFKLTFQEFNELDDELNKIS